PAAVVGVLAGVALSNMSMFEGRNSYLLARIFGGFMLYLAVYNMFRFGGRSGGEDGRDISQIRRSALLAMVSGAAAGVGNGLLGIGGGSIATPLQQLFLKMPLKRAMANSSAMIMGISLFGAAYKNATLGQHGITWAESLRIAAIVAPTAIVGAALGARLMHKVHKDWVRAAFIGVAILAAWRLLTVAPRL
ncbi:MAG TPA: sulfite exporter TauE/SafE family protein, partial [Sedimentisphaerales bacterium]|nr:sulfite exporter TauE/SafE family protein [Sedimentisphaerales bacterium]